MKYFYCLAWGLQEKDAMISRRQIVFFMKFIVTWKYVSLNPWEVLPDSPFAEYHSYSSEWKSTLKGVSDAEMKKIFKFFIS